MHSFTNFALLALASTQATQAALTLGAAQSYGTLAGSQLANTGTTFVTGDIGTWPGTVIAGYGPGQGTYTLTAQPGTAIASNAQKACVSAFKAGTVAPATGSLPPNLSGLTIPPGVYKFPASTSNVFIDPATVLTLNGASNPYGQWIFQVPALFTTGVNSAVQVVGGGLTCNVFFIVAKAAILGDSTRFQGNILAYDTIRVGKGASNTRGTFCAIQGPAITAYNKLTAYLPVCVSR